MLYLKIKKWCSQSLLETIPTYLSTVLENYISTMIGHSNDSQITSHLKEETVYDILNAGPGHRFTILTDKGPRVVSNCVQSTGHDILMLWVAIYSEMLDNQDINWNPIVADFHDESIVECDEKDAEIVMKIMGTDSLVRLNEILGGEIPLRLDGGIIEDLAEAKVPREG